MKAIVIILATMILASCAQNSLNVYELPPEKNKPYDKVVMLNKKQLAFVKKGIAAGLKDPNSALFGDMVTFQDQNGVLRVCGYVNGRNSFGGYTGMQPFLAVYVPSENYVNLVRVGSTPIERASISKVCLKNTKAGEPLPTFKPGPS